MAELGGLAVSYAAGALSTLSPCVLPLLPIILFGALEQHACGPVALAAGLSASFATVGIFLASLGFSIGIDPATFRLGGAALMLIIGMVLLAPALQSRFARIAAPVATRGQALVDRLQLSGIGGQFALGILLGAIWSPCSGPTFRPRRPERNCWPRGRLHGRVQPGSCNADFGARLRLTASDLCPSRLGGPGITHRQTAHWRRAR